MKQLIKQAGTAWLGLIQDLVPFFMLLLFTGLFVLAVKHPITIPFIAVALLLVYSSKAREFTIRVFKGIGLGLGTIFAALLSLVLEYWWIALLLLII